LAEGGAVFSAYLTRAEAGAPRRLVLEDVLVWRGEPIWSTKNFTKRWSHYMKLFVTQEFKADPVLQGFTVELATYTALSALVEPNERQVAEFVPDDPGNKRLIWKAPDGVAAATVVPVPPTVSSTGSVPDTVATTATTVTATTAIPGFVAKKEAGMGPDVYAVYKNGVERVGLALVRTLAISKALRLAITAEKTEVPIKAVFNKTFEKYEVLEVLSAA
jgi:phage-related protein